MADKLLGSFVWCELLTTDTAAADSFYKKVVGWSSVPFAPGNMVLNNPAGAGVGGVMKLPDQAKQMGAPPHWLMYVGTPSVDDTAMRIARLGGRVLKQPEDIPNTGRFAVVQDPFGATFGIFQPSPNRPGRSGEIWRRGLLVVRALHAESRRRVEFLSHAVRLEKTSAMDMGEMGVYQMFGRGGNIPNGGIMKPPPGAPAAWAPYVRVKDAKAAAATATTNGGKIINGPMEVPGGDWIFQGIDPQGAMFSVHSLKPAAKAAPAKKKAAKKAAPKKAKAKPVKKSAKKSKPAKKKTSKKKAAKKKVARKKSARRKK